MIGVSIGISVGPGDGSNPDKLLRNADLALYRAKGDGRGTFRFFEPAMDLQMQTRRIMEQDLRKALPAGEFELHYQPVVNLASKEISGFEALIRWNHPSKGMVSPADFIPLAEEIGFIVPMGEWVIRQACATAAQWPEQPSRRRQYFSDPVSQSRPDAGDRQRARGFRPRARRGLRSRSPKPSCCTTRKRRLPCFTSCGRSASGSRWTISAPDIPR